MNKIRRKQLQEASELIAKAQGIIESVKDDEQEAHDNLPESIQYGEKGQQMEEYIDMLDEAYGQCGDLMSIMTELWLKAGTAMWKEDEPEPQAAQAIPVTAVAGMPGMSDAGTDGLIGRIPETPERKTTPAKKPTRTTTRKKKA